jgi:hypothetical protein
MSPRRPVCRTLEESQESRRRAWKALQGLRQVIAGIADDPLPQPSKPPCFETEGQVLKGELLKILNRLSVELDEADKTIEAMRPFIDDTKRDGSFPHHLLQFNRVMAKLRARASALRVKTEKMGRACS